LLRFARNDAWEELRPSIITAILRCELHGSQHRAAVADVTAMMTSQVIALLREAIHVETTMNWEEI
jgi:hypothetical protein